MAVKSAASSMVATKAASPSGGFSAFDGFTITNPALVALVGYAIIVFMVLLPVDMYTFDEKNNKYAKQRYSFPHRLLIALLLLFPFLLSVYSVNCMMVGNCVAWSWIVAVITILWAMIIAITTFSTGAFSVDELI